jgi:uncharacterized NAD(P)/FAD-binding protein YdhS
MMRNAKFSVVIVGGGFSGSVLAVQLLRRVPNLPVAVIEKRPAPGRGLAYGTRHYCHLLNVRAGNMSALPEDPDHFLRWARTNYDRSAQATSFLPRRVYGQYVGSLVDEVIGHNPAGRLEWIEGEVASLAHDRSKVLVQLKNGRTLVAHALVLAVGNHPPANLNIPGLSKDARRYVCSPWPEGALRDLPKNAEVLLAGSGLTSVDVAVALKSEGFTGHIHFLSRHGLMPQTHCRAEKWPQFWNEQSPRTARGLMRLVREQAQAAAKKGSDWRAVIDAIRPVTQTIWQALPLNERRRFLRHVRSYWEVHRHRIAGEIGETIGGLIRDRQASLFAGRVTGYRENSEYAEVTVGDRKTGSQRVLRVDRVINCTGPEADYRRIEDPLIKNLLEQGHAKPDALSLGLEVDSKGALVDSEGNASPSLYAIGPARKGLLWETTAVPELRKQASELAEHLAGAAVAHTRDMQDELLSRLLSIWQSPSESRTPMTAYSEAAGD